MVAGGIGGRSVGAKDKFAIGAAQKQKVITAAAAEKANYLAAQEQAVSAVLDEDWSVLDEFEGFEPLDLDGGTEDLLTLIGGGSSRTGRGGNRPPTNSLFRFTK